MRLVKFLIAFIAFAIDCTIATKDPNFSPGRTAMVHLFEWKWNDIADECERFLGPNGFGGIQVSPVTENVMTNGRPWHERYQPISYKLITRSGNETEFIEMIRRCNAAGVRIYVDMVINHMSSGHPDNVGTGGSTADPSKRQYPAVPYVDAHFNSPICGITDYNDPIQVRNCELVGLRDLNQTLPYVRGKIIDLMNVLIDHGVAGFRIDAAKHMWPNDMQIIYDSLKNLNTKHGFKANARPYIVQEVIDLGHDAVKRTEYTPLGAVTEFRFSTDIGRVFQGQVELKHLQNWGTGWSFVDSDNALVFVDNHDNQRDGNANILTYHNGKDYRMATAWALAHPYGRIVRIMSSFDFQIKDQGPPHDDNFNILSPTINADGTCGNGWVCEHRWSTTVNLVDFRNVADGAPISMWFDNGNNQIAFSRGSRTFIAFNRQNADFDMTIQTNLPAGTYCDIISGKRVDNSCTGSSISVDAFGNAHILLPANSANGVIAIHVGAKSKLN